MSKRDIPTKGGGEYDALTNARKWYAWKPGQLHQIKAGFNRRSRRVAKKNLKEDRDGGQ